MTDRFLIDSFIICTRKHHLFIPCQTMSGILLSIEVKIQTQENIYPLFVRSQIDTWKTEKQMLECWCAEIQKSRSQRGLGDERLRPPQNVFRCRISHPLRQKWFANTGFSLWRNVFSLPYFIVTYICSLGFLKRQSQNSISCWTSIFFCHS